MRIVSWILLVGGFFLCVSVAWAAPGFLLMGCGLILLQVDEQKRKRRNKQPSGYTVQSDALGQHIESPEAVSIIGGSMVRQGGPSAQSYDLEAWRRLVESDPDLARLSSLLAEHGQQYLDELARRYLAAADKRSLAAIVEEIVATVERDAGRRCARQEEDDPRAVMPRNTLRDEGSSDEALTVAARAPTQVPHAADDVAGQPVKGIEIVTNAPKPTRDGRSSTIISADDDLEQMMRSLASRSVSSSHD